MTKLKRTDTTLDLSQQAEKRIPFEERKGPTDFQTDILYYGTITRPFGANAPNIAIECILGDVCTKPADESASKQSLGSVAVNVDDDESKFVDLCKRIELPCMVYGLMVCLCEFATGVHVDCTLRGHVSKQVGMFIVACHMHEEHAVRCPFKLFVVARQVLNPLSC